MKEFTYQDYLKCEKISMNSIRKIFNILLWNLLNIENVLHDSGPEE